MHEMSLCEGILQILDDNAKSQGFERVKTVWLEVGGLSGVDLDALRFCFDAVTRGSLADNAKLEVIQVPGAAWCMKCSKQVRVDKRFDACPDCGSFQLQVIGGEEMKIKELEVQ